LLQPPQVKGEAVPLPGQDLQPVPAAVPKYKQVAAQRVPAEVVADHGLEAVKALATVLRLDTDPDPPGQAEGEHSCLPRAATRRATASGSAPSGTRTTTPPGNTSSALGSVTTWTAANLGTEGGEVVGIPSCPLSASSRRRA